MTTPVVAEKTACFFLALLRWRIPNRGRPGRRDARTRSRAIVRAQRCVTAGRVSKLVPDLGPFPDITFFVIIDVTDDVRDTLPCGRDAHLEAKAAGFNYNMMPARRISSRDWIRLHVRIQIRAIDILERIARQPAPEIGVQDTVSDVIEAVGCQ